MIQADRHSAPGSYRTRPRRWARALALLLGLLVVPAAAAALTLPEAEALAVAGDPEAARLQALSHGLEERAVADAQLPDPRVRAGIVSLPTDTFDFDQEPMTQLQIGASQQFPRGRSLEIESRRTRALSSVEAARAAERARTVVRAVRRAWLDRQLQLRALAIVDDSRQVFAKLAEITERRYAAGRQNQQDVLRAQLELARLDDREARREAALAEAEAELARWLGDEAVAGLAADDALAALPAPPPVATLEAALPAHPAVAADSARIAAARQEVALARQAYRPAWTLDLGYGLRDGEDAMGDERPDFVSAMVSLDVPLFTAKRQDRRLAARQQEMQAALRARDERLRELRRRLRAAWSEMEALQRRSELYEQTLLPRGTDTTRATLNAYQSDAADFPTLMRAQIAELEIRLAALEVAVALGQARADVLYFAEAMP